MRPYHPAVPVIVPDFREFSGPWRAFARQSTTDRGAKRQCQQTLVTRNGGANDNICFFHV